MATGNAAIDTPAMPGVTSSPMSRRRLLLYGFVAFVAGLMSVFWLTRPIDLARAGFYHSATETITAGRQARIIKVLVKTGQSVSPGVPLLQLEDAHLEQARNTQLTLIHSLEAELRQAQARASVEIADRKAKLESEIFEARLKQAAFEEKRFDNRLALFSIENRVMVSEAEGRLGQIQMVSADEAELPFVPLMIADETDNVLKNKDFLLELQEREMTRNKLEASEAQVALCESRLDTLKSQLATAATQINEAFGVNVIQTRIQTAQTSLALLETQTPHLTICATKFGTVGLFTKSEGNLVGPQDPIVELFDGEQPYVIADIPTADLSKLAVGSCVELVFPGKVARQGIVAEIPPQTATLSNKLGEICRSDSRLRIRILPKGQVWPQVPFGTFIEVAPCSRMPEVNEVAHSCDNPVE